MFSDAIRKPRIDLYTICWNEKFMLEYFFRYYDRIVDRYVVYDDGSTDGTLEILNDHPKVEIRRLPRLEHADSYILSAQNVHNNAWKESRGHADWVILTAIDEFVYVPDFVTYLVDCTAKGVTVIPALGYEMISASLPLPGQNLPDVIKRGAPWHMLNKLSVFDPNAIAETNFHFGRHNARPTGKVQYPENDELLILHYKYLSYDYTSGRHSELNAKLGSMDKKKGWGIHYGYSKRKFKENWEFFEQRSVEDLFSKDYHPNQMHSRIWERWWRINELGRIFLKVYYFLQRLF